MDRDLVERVFAAAKAEEAEVGYPWCAVSLYLRMYPGTGYRTVESGVSAAVQSLARSGKILRVSRGRFRCANIKG